MLLPAARIFRLFMLSPLALDLLMPLLTLFALLHGFKGPLSPPLASSMGFLENPNRNFWLQAMFHTVKQECTTEELKCSMYMINNGETPPHNALQRCGSCFDATSPSHGYPAADGISVSRGIVFRVLSGRTTSIWVQGASVVFLSVREACHEHC